jgi:beta-glucosidase
MVFVNPTSKPIDPLNLSDSSSRAMNFPTDFLWGVSTAAHQVEGGNNNNQWSAWEAAGRIRSGDICGQACDWWTNAERDFDLAQLMGLNALRLSVEWSRIEPEENHWDLQALKRYRTALLGLRQRGIKPMVCLHHFTHPLWFEAGGAFLKPNAAPIFVRFVQHVVEALGDVCQDWVTFNEPNVYAALGYVLGEYPPGKTSEVATAVRVANAMARAHAQAYHAIHRLQSHALVGWAHNYVVFEAANHRSRLDRWTAGLLSQLFNEIFLSAIENGRLDFPLNLADGDVASAKGTCDFVGLNVYSRFHVAFSAEKSSQLFADVFVPAHVPQGDCGVEKPYGEAYPEAIGVAVRRASRLHKPIYILENGVPDAGDRIRPWLLVNAVKQLHDLLREGHDIRGYFHWTLIDNFEWTEGWNLRFGLVALDPLTQERTMRQSGELYSAIARANALSPEVLAEFGTSKLFFR